MCKHSPATLTSVRDANHKWSGEVAGHGFLWVVCPKQFKAHVGGRSDPLDRWAAADFPDGWTYAISNLWILSPDPGCEL